MSRAMVPALIMPRVTVTTKHDYLAYYLSASASKAILTWNAEFRGQLMVWRFSALPQGRGLAGGKSRGYHPALVLDDIRGHSTDLALLGQHEGKLLAWSDTGEVCSVVNIAGSFVFGYLGIGARRPGTVDLAGTNSHGSAGLLSLGVYDRFRRNPFLHPILDRTPGIKILLVDHETRAPRGSGDHKETGKVLCLQWQ